MGLGERLWVGEPGRLSLDDREWWRPEEKLRLVCSTDDCFEIFLKSDFRLGLGTQILQNPCPQRPGPPKCATGPASTLPGSQAAAHRSCVSRLRLRLFLRAMRPLVTFFRAGPTLMEVFSRGVVRRAILLPLCRRDGKGSPVCLPSNELSMHPPTHLLIHWKPRILTTRFLPNDPPTHWAKDGCLPSVHPSNEPSTHPLVPGAIQLGVCLLTCVHLPASRPQPLRTLGLRGGRRPRWYRYPQPHKVRVGQREGQEKGHPGGRKGFLEEWL